MKRLIKKFLSTFQKESNQSKSKDAWSLNQDPSAYLAESEKLKWLKHFQFETILDIGANEGQFAQKIHFIFPEAAIHCFEPLGHAFEQLVRNVSNFSRAYCHHFALGKENCVMKINKNEYSPSSSLLNMLDLHKDNFKFAVMVESEEIEVRKLNDVQIEPFKRPLLIKIDVQGYEMKVIEGGFEVIKQADVVVIETSYYPLYNEQPLFDDIYKYFIENGFRFAGNVDQLVAPNSNKILQGDAVFIKATQMIN